MQTIRIYNGPGVEKRCLPSLRSELSSWKTAFISAKDILSTNWEEKTSLLLIPGGRDVPYHEALKGEGNFRIKRFVENGGAFLGICAGAYYGCSEVEFDRGMELEVLGTRELAFYPGTGRGPAYGPGTFHYNSELGARCSLISDEFFGGSFQSYFNGGCYFVEVEKFPHVQVIAKYLDIPGEPAAAIEIPFGKGRVALTGVHIEKNSNSTLDQKMAQELTPFEPQRQRFFHHLLLRLLNID